MHAQECTNNCLTTNKRLFRLFSLSISIPFYVNTIKSHYSPKFRENPNWLRIPFSHIFFVDRYDVVLFVILHSDTVPLIIHLQKHCITIKDLLFSFYFFAFQVQCHCIQYMISCGSRPFCLYLPLSLHCA